MMRITIDMNGRSIGCLLVHNEGEISEISSMSNPRRYAVYDAKDVRPDTTLDETDPLFRVTHDRDDGASALISIVMDRIDEKVLD